MTVECLGIDHIYITVSNMERSRAFYNPVMNFLGFRTTESVIADDTHTHYYNRHFGFSLRPARHNVTHDPYSPGLHHFCFRVEGNAQVDAFAKAMNGIGIEVSKPDYYAYAPDYYAAFFQDPDGVRLEVTNYRQQRRDRFNHWDGPNEPVGD